MSRSLSRLFTQRVTPSLRASFQTPSHRISQSRFQFPQRRSYATGESGPNPRPGKNTIKAWPIVAITLAGTGAYVFMVKSRTGQDMSPTNNPLLSSPQSSGQIPAPKKDKPTFSADDVTVIFVLGGPGAGKGTQCDKLVKDYHFTHLSAGDLLRAEQDRPGSQFGGLIKDCIKNGAIVPMEVTVQLLENAMTDTLNSSSGTNSSSPKGKGRFLIDGFPRKMDQALKFEESVCPAKFVLFFDCPEEVMEKRLLKRGETSGRADDNLESIKKRFKTFVDTSMPVVDHYEKEGRVAKVAAVKTPDEVYGDVRKVVEKRLGKDF